MDQPPPKRLRQQPSISTMAGYLSFLPSFRLGIGIDKDVAGWRRGGKFPEIFFVYVLGDRNLAICFGSQKQLGTKFSVFGLWSFL